MELRVRGEGKGEGEEAGEGAGRLCMLAVWGSKAQGCAMWALSSCCGCIVTCWSAVVPIATFHTFTTRLVEP